MSEAKDAPKTMMQRVLDVVEKVGNKVPHPAIIFLLLIAIVVVVSALLEATGTSHSTYEVIVPEPPAIATGAAPGPSVYDSGTTVAYQAIDPAKYRIETRTVSAKSLLTAEGIRFMYSSLIPSFMGFTAVGLMIVAMIGAGVAEESGLVKALIRKLVIVSPGWALTYILAFVGIVSSIAADAGYLVLIPLAGIAFLSVGRHPLAGLALGFAAVAGAFTVNMLIKPLDAVLVEFTNDAIHLVDPSKIDRPGLQPLVLDRVGPLPDGADRVHHRANHRAAAGRVPRREKPDEQRAELSADEARGLRCAVLGLLGGAGCLWLVDATAGGALAQSGHRRPDRQLAVHERPDRPHHGRVPGDRGRLRLRRQDDEEPDRHHQGDGEGAGRPGRPDLSVLGPQPVRRLLQLHQHGHDHGPEDVRRAQDGEYRPAAGCSSASSWSSRIIDLLITGAIAKWAIFAPIFVPLLMKLGVDPEAVLAAYRVGDSPMNAITPLNAYFALVVGFAQKYDKNAGVGTVVSLMLPYVVDHVRPLDAPLRRLAGAGTALGAVTSRRAFIARRQLPAGIGSPPQDHPEVDRYLGTQKGATP